MEKKLVSNGVILMPFPLATTVLGVLKHFKLYCKFKRRKKQIT